MPTYFAPTHHSSDLGSTTYSRLQESENQSIIPVLTSLNFSSSPIEYFDVSEMEQISGEQPLDPMDIQPNDISSGINNSQAVDELQNAVKELNNAVHYIQQAEARAANAERDSEEFRKALHDLRAQMQTIPQINLAQPPPQLSRPT